MDKSFGHEGSIDRATVPFRYDRESAFYSSVLLHILLILSFPHESLINFRNKQTCSLTTTYDMNAFMNKRLPIIMTKETYKPNVKPRDHVGTDDDEYAGS